MTYEGTIEEGEGSEWEETGDEECDEPSGTVKSDEKKTFPRTKPKAVSRRSLLTELIHGNDGGSALQNLASCSSPESRRPRTPNGSRASSPSSTRHKMFSREITGSLRQELFRERRVTSALNRKILSIKLSESRGDFDAGLLDYHQKGW